jgi:hypothetical protein
VARHRYAGVTVKTLVRLGELRFAAVPSILQLFKKCFRSEAARADACYD